MTNNFELVKQNLSALNEYAFSRLYKHMQDKTVGLISAYRKSNPRKVNQENQNSLKQDVKARGLSWNEINGYYLEAGEDEAKKERTLVIYSDESKESMKKWLVPLGQKYNQDSILIVVDGQGYLVGAVGDDNLKPYEEVSIGNFTASKAGDIYSQRGKDTFVFESILPDSMAGAYSRKAFSQNYVNDTDSFETVLEKLVKRIKKASLIMEEFEADNVAALADYMGVQPDEVKELDLDLYGIPMYEVEGEEWAVTDDYDLCETAAKEDVANLIDELGIESLNWYNMGGMENYLDADWFEQAREESNESYAQDIHDSEFNRFVEELKELGLNPDDPNYELDNEDGDHSAAIADLASAMKKLQEDDPIEWYINNFGKEDLNYLIKKGAVSIDTNKAAEEAISVDGLGHILSGYDGKMVEHEFEGKTYYMFRNN